MNISGEIDVNIIGDYIIVYSATDAAGNMTSITRNVVIVAARPFISSWKTDNLSFGSSNINQIKIGTREGEYHYQIDWGDGTSDENVTGDIVNTYAAAGTYTVSINGKFPQIDIYDDRLKIISIEQWGDIKWQSMEDAFFLCENLIGNANDTPDLSQVTNMRYMFAAAIKFNQSINDWDVSNVRNMGYMFQFSQSFNQDLNSWDVSNVSNMSNMFSAAHSFNGDISSWDVSNVTDMSRMFEWSTSFNRDIGQWGVSNVTDMLDMFYKVEFFNQDIGNWDVSSVTNMKNMFYGVKDFDRNIGKWDVSNVTDMSNMLFDVTLSTRNYNILLHQWNAQPLQYNVKFHGGHSQYPVDAQSARNVLTETFGWTVIDGGIAAELNQNNSENQLLLQPGVH